MSPKAMANFITENPRNRPYRFPSETLAHWKKGDHAFPENRTDHEHGWESNKSVPSYKPIARVVTEDWQQDVGGLSSSTI
jgi:hypothetical protein